MSAAPETSKRSPFLCIVPPEPFVKKMNVALTIRRDT